MSKLNLILHCGGTEVERNALSGVVLPPTTKSYQPIGHDYFVDLVQDKLEARGLRVVSEAHGLVAGGADYFGMFEVRGDGAERDYSTVVGMRNSHRKYFPAAIAVGGGVFVCDNLAFTGEVVVGHKHTVNVLEFLPQRIEHAMDGVIRLDRHQALRYDAYKNRRFSDNEAERMMIDLFRSKILSTKTLPKVVEQWDTPDHEEFRRNNVWRLFNACTESFKGMSPNTLLDVTPRLHQVLDEVCDVEPLALAA